MDMQFEYGVGYDGQQSITVGYSFEGPLGQRIESTFVSTDVDVMAKAVELIDTICTKHALTRKVAPAPALDATPTPAPDASPVTP